jgi:uncharacterized protein (DUF486 family)
MVDKTDRVLLVGDNPFHNISHLSQDRTKLRDRSVVNPSYAAKLVMTSLDNGANGFMFSVSETTLSILERIREEGRSKDLTLFAIVPYAYEYVRLAAQTGGIPGLAKVFSRQLVSSGNFKAIAAGASGLLRGDPVSLLQAYLSYEIGRTKSSAGKQAKIESILLHEVIVDMALALDLGWFFKAYIEFMKRHGYTPGFNTCNFAYMVGKFRSWNIALAKMVVAAPFNKIGFQMNPSRDECERALRSLGEPILIAISILAAGYLKLDNATKYVASLPNVKGAAVGVSKEEHAEETFRLLSSSFGK